MEKIKISRTFKQWFLLLLGIALLPLASASYFYYHLVVEQLSQQVDDELHSRAEGLITYFDTWTEMSLKLLKHNAVLENIVSMNPVKQKSILQSIVKEYGKWTYLAQVTTLDGNSAARSDNEQSRYLGDRDWFQKALKNDYGLDVQIGESLEHPRCIIAVPIFNRDQKIVGILSTENWPTEVFDFMTAVKIGETGQLFVISDKGNVLAHYKKNFARGPANFSKHPLGEQQKSDKKKKFIFIDAKSRKKTVALAKQGRFEWIAVVQQDYTEAYASVKQARWHALTLLIASLIFVMLLAALIAAYLSRELNKEKGQLKTGFFAKLVFSTLIPSALPLSIYWTVHHPLYLSYFTQRLSEHLSIKSDHLVSRINIWMEMDIKKLKQIASLEDMVSMDIKKQLPILHSITKEYPWHWIAHITLPGGKQTLRTDGTKLQNHSDRKYIQQVVAGASFGTEVTIGKASGKAIQALAVPIRNNAQQLIAILSANSILADLSEIMLNMEISDHGYAYWLTQDGILAGHQKKAFTQTVLDFSKLPPFVELAGKNKKQIIFRDKSSGGKMISYAQRTRLGWIVVIQQNIEGSIPPIKMNQKMVLIFIAEILLALLVSFLAIRTKPYLGRAGNEPG